MPTPAQPQEKEYDVGGPMAQLGSIVQTRRQLAGLTINSLATRSAVSAGLLSQIERGIGNPSYTTLIKIAHALDVKVGTFFGGEEPEAESASLVRATQRRRLLLTERDLVYELLTPSMNGRLAMIQARMAPGWSNEAVPYEHEGEECVLISEGRLTINVGGARYDLMVGDSLTYDASQPHWYWNETDEPAVLISAMTPPSF